VGVAGPGAAVADMTMAPPLYEFCTNQKYPQGLGRTGRRDQTDGTPVTSFKRSTKLYHLAMSHNPGLDRDEDGIACEKA
jgi:hypothetical protein